MAKGVNKKIFLTNIFNPVYLTLSSIINNKIKLYINMLILFKYFFLELISNKEVIKEITGMYKGKIILRFKTEIISFFALSLQNFSNWLIRKQLIILIVLVSCIFGFFIVKFNSVDYFLW